MSPHTPQAAFLLIMPTANDAPLFAVPENAEAAVHTIQELRSEHFFALYAYSVLPDHIRILLRPEPGKTLKDVLRSLRGGIARALTARGARGAVWMPRSEIRKLWNDDALSAAAKEVDAAPMTVGLVPAAESFRFSSAHPESEVDAIDSVRNTQTAVARAVKTA